MNWLLDHVLYFLFVILLVALALIVFAAMHDLCFNSASFSCRDQQVQRCIESERYSRDECIRLVGGGNE